MRIVVERLSYSYQRQRVFGDLNLHIEAGSSVALLGESGVGKSTLLRLLAGLETPQEGQILLGGRTPLELRGLGEVAILAQEPALFPHRPRNFYSVKV
jgi:ABC-type Fe3+/spermidine/putrescine transport system ATPase subunit